MSTTAVPVTATQPQAQGVRRRAPQNARVHANVIASHPSQYATLTQGLRVCQRRRKSCSRGTHGQKSVATVAPIRRVDLDRW